MKTITLVTKKKNQGKKKCQQVSNKGRKKMKEKKKKNANPLET